MDNNIEMNIPHASEAKKVYESGEYEKAKKQAITISTRINEAIKLGNRSISFTTLEPGVKKALESKEYTIKWWEGDFRDRNPGYYIISW